MFSSFVNFTHQQSSPSSARPASPARTRSSDSHGSSTGQLAENALSNLRKSLASQRSASPVQTPKGSPAPRPHKMTLEDRLKAATFTIGEASGDTTPAASSRVSPAPPLVTTPSEAPNDTTRLEAAIEHPLSPSSTPLPESRVSSPIEVHEPTPILAVAAPTPSDLLPFASEPVNSELEPTALEHNEVLETPSPPPESATSLPLAEPAPSLPRPEPAPSLSPSEPASSSQSVELPSDPLSAVSPRPRSVQIDSVTVLEAEASLLVDSTPNSPSNEGVHINDVDTLQERLKLVEQRFSDVSLSFKRLQAEKAAADAVLKELTPLETISDSQAFRDFVQNVIMKSEISLEEITRLNGKLGTQEERIEELRDTHRLESSSQSAQIEKLKKQLSESEALLAASQGQSDENSSASKVEIERLTKEVESSKRIAKEEEEKRVKAISLLKTVRQKLVKAEKERDDIQREIAASKDKDRAEKDRDQLEKSKLQSELETVHAEREKAVIGLKTQFDRELTSLRDKHEKETAVMRGQFELEALTTKSSHSKEVTTLASRIATLESTVTSLTNDKNTFFDQLQMRQAELESSQSHLDSLQSQNTELQYQLRESEERFALLNDDISEVRREQDSRAREPTTSAEEVSRLLAAAEAKYELKLADLRKNMNAVERERNESEAQWSRKLREKVRENDELKQVLGSAAKNRELDEDVVEKLKDQIRSLQEEVRLHQAQVEELRAQTASFQDAESSTKAQETEISAKLHSLEQLLEDHKSRETQLKTSNKTLREELRKVQSSAALLERQRNPGVGYWSRESATSDPRNSMSSVSDSRVASPTLSVPPKQEEEEVNLEYLRNVILQFLEHKEMRPNLVKVLSIILHFTPQETRRLWISLCKMFLGKQNAFDSPHATQRALSNSVLILYRSFPGDPDLQEYLKIAIQSELPLAVFVSTFLSAARSTELHAPATLDMLCRTALDAHYSSGIPTGLSFAETPMTVSNTLQDALALLRVAYELPISHYHQLTTSASELIILLFSAADMSQVPPSQAIVLLNDVSTMMTHASISQDVRQVLESFALSLGLLVGDDAKAASDVHLMHSFQLALGKTNTVGSSTNTDTVSLSLTLSYLVTHRAKEFGAGSGTDPAALLVSLFRWSSWAPPVFYTQLLLSAFICLSETSAVSPVIWRAFLVGRLPSVLLSFEKLLNTDSAAPENWKTALQVAVTSILRRAELVERCDRIVNQFANSHSTHPEDSTLSRILPRDFLRSLLLSGLVDQSFVVAMDPTFSNDTTVYLQSEAQDLGLELEAYLSSKLSPDMDFDEIRLWIERIWNDSSSHKTFTDIALQRFKASANSLDPETLETLSFWSRVFCLCDTALDMISLHSRISDLICHALLFLQQSDCETVGDPQSAVSHIGDVVLFVQSTLVRFHLDADTFTSGSRSVSSRFLRSTAIVHPLDTLSGEDAVAFSAWYKALFDRSSEGIEDTILRSTQPKVLLRVSASLFSHAIKDANIDEEVLNNGISYFTGPLLRWTLVGVVQALMQEIQFKGFSAPKHFNVLQTLFLSNGVPRIVKCLCGQGVQALLLDKRIQNVTNFDVVSMHRAILHALGMPNGEYCPCSLSVFVHLRTGHSRSPPLDTQIPGQPQPRQAIRNAIAKARASKAPYLDIERSLRTCGCEKFLTLLWSELLPTANLGESDICTRIATFALTMPRPSDSPPLLAMFLNILLPRLLTTIDSRQAGDQTVAIDLLGSIVSSVLTASLHLDLAFTEVRRPVLGQPCTVMARRVASDLRSRAKMRGHASQMILQRLASSQSFVANFSIFKSDS
ncbi:mediator of RNA polymerase II transcription subunit 5 [Favolaschia claudopus]|uniref:Mediator of RNA polymerase II transcription subunit 5 n=1 Tax=Favolaschia claudopus TaxID=2862362 RepID=A0AAW0EII3_9AGAR